MPTNNKCEEYDKYAYDHEDAPVDYEKKRGLGIGILGKFRKSREDNAVHSAIQQFMNNVAIVDCPCGTGRWFKKLGFRAKKIIAIDISEHMLNYAKKIKLKNCQINILKSDATNISMKDNSVNNVFSFALMKHVPYKIQLIILKEFSRISTERVVVSFPIFRLSSYVFWKLTGSNGFPLWFDDLKTIVSKSGLQIGAMYKIGLPVIGLEYLIVFERKDEFLN